MWFFINNNIGKVSISLVLNLQFTERILASLITTIILILSLIHTNLGAVRENW